MTRLISNSTRSSRAASTDGGTGAPGTAGELSIGVLAALLTGLPGRAGPRTPRRGDRRRGGTYRPTSQCPTPAGPVTGPARGVRYESAGSLRDRSTTPPRAAARLLALVTRR